VSEQEEVAYQVHVCDAAGLYPDSTFTGVHATDREHACVRARALYCEYYNLPMSRLLQTAVLRP
jgi:hypothetical protein